MSAVRVRLGDVTFAGGGRILEATTAEDALARTLLLQKYAPTYSGSLDGWGKTALPVAIDVTSVASKDASAALWPKGRRLG